MNWLLVEYGPLSQLGNSREDHILSPVPPGPGKQAGGHCEPRAAGTSAGLEAHSEITSRNVLTTMNTGLVRKSKKYKRVSPP